MKNLINPENEAEARALKSLLEEHGIHAQIVSFHDTAYDGLFQAQYGWGVIRVRPGDLSLARQIIKEWRMASPDSVDWQEE